MNVLWEELTAGLANPDDLLRVAIRLIAAIVCGGIMGLKRVSPQKPAGLRTHILVCLGTTVLLLLCSAAALSPEGTSRVIEGVVIGIGFLGAGSILKLSEEHLIHGLTASARIWTTAVVGTAVGLGRIGIALITAVLTVLILWAIGMLEGRVQKRLPEKANDLA
jgi:putative Mg2+ transporter-C (MgtC) family protein